jgi:hypothetical protein
MKWSARRIRRQKAPQARWNHRAIASVYNEISGRNALVIARTHLINGFALYQGATLSRAEHGISKGPGL